MSLLGLHGLIGAGGFDIRKYNNLLFAGQVNILAINTFQTVLSVTGEGFLSSLSMSGTSANRCKITMDGVVVFDGAAGGILTRDSILYDSVTAGNAVIPNANTSPYISVTTTSQIQSHPYTSGGAAIVILEIPLFFKSSLLIEMRSSTTGNKQLTYRGGIKA